MYWGGPYGALRRWILSRTTSLPGADCRKLTYVRYGRVLDHSGAHTCSAQRADEETYLSMIRSALASSHLYFSASYDLTNTAQVMYPLI